MNCKSCGLEKDPSLFYKSNKSKCKECVKDTVKENRREKIEYYREYDRNRSNKDERNKKQIERSRERYHSDPDYKRSVLETKDAYIKRNPEKRKANVAVGNAVRDGRLVKHNKCEHCRTTEKSIEAHHWSYEPEHWLDVIWLCTTCHGEEHKRLNELGRDPDKEQGNPL